MKIYTLRHEHRYSNITSDTSLNQYGLKNANSSLIEELNKLNIKTVYASSFLRCLQTLSPYPNHEFICFQCLPFRILKSWDSW